MGSCGFLLFVKMSIEARGGSLFLLRPAAAAVFLRQRRRNRGGAKKKKSAFSSCTCKFLLLGFSYSIAVLASAHCSYPDVSATFSWAFLWCCNSRKRNGLCFLVPLTVILFFVFLSFFPCMLCSLLLLLRRRFDVVEGRCSWGRFVVGGSLVFFLLRFFVIVSLYHPGVRLPSKNGDSH